MNNIEIILTNFILNIGPLGYILTCLLIITESILPILPLSLFSTILIYKFGYILGFVLSYICTILGCILSYKIFNGKLSIKFKNYVNKMNKDKLNKVVDKISNIKFTTLCLLIALPFTPQFLINISCGLVDISKKKYILSLLIGKIFLIIFWIFIGTSFISSFRNPINLIYIVLLLSVCFILSKLISKKEGIE